MKNHYKILGVAFNASYDDIKVAYRKLALRFHPDKNYGDRRSEEAFKEINASYEVLSDSKKRSDYDFYYRKYYQNSTAQTFQKKETIYTPTLLLRKIKDIKEYANFSYNALIYHKEIFSMLKDALSSGNLDMLIKTDEKEVNLQIIMEVEQCCSKLPYPYVPYIINRLTVLAETSGFSKIRLRSFIGLQFSKSIWSRFKVGIIFTVIVFSLYFYSLYEDQIRFGKTSIPDKNGYDYNTQEKIVDTTGEINFK